MNAPPCRRFNLGDAMIAVATVALIFALRPTDPGSFRAIREAWSSPLSGYRYVETLVLICRHLTSSWLCLTIGWACCRLWKPRPSMQEIRGQPGFVAGLVALATAGCSAGTLANSRWHDPRDTPFANDLWVIILAVSPAVIGSWLCLWSLGRWCPEPGWIDRSGRLLGWGWIVLYLLHQGVLSFVM